MTQVNIQTLNIKDYIANLNKTQGDNSDKELAVILQILECLGEKKYCLPVENSTTEDLDMDKIKPHRVTIAILNSIIHTVNEFIYLYNGITESHKENITNAPQVVDGKLPPSMLFNLQSKLDILQKINHQPHASELFDLLQEAMFAKVSQEQHDILLKLTRVLDTFEDEEETERFCEILISDTKKTGITITKDNAKDMKLYVTFLKEYGLN